MENKPFLLAATATACVLAFTSLASKPPKPPMPSGGTDILHLSVRKAMANEGAPTNATGRVDLNQNQQGKANNQRLDIAAAKLETNTTYQLWAVLGDDTNFTYAASFTSSARGKASLRYMKVGSSNGKLLGKGKTPLPDVLDPISNIREIAIANVNTQAVLTADLAAPDKLQYLIKRSLHDGDVVAALRLKATVKKLQFRLLAGGLTPATNYFLAVNGGVVTSAASATNGVVDFKSLPVLPADILNVRTLAIWDSASNSVLSTTLP